LTYDILTAFEDGALSGGTKDRSPVRRAYYRKLMRFKLGSEECPINYFGGSSRASSTDLDAHLDRRGKAWFLSALQQQLHREKLERTSCRLGKGAAPGTQNFADFLVTNPHALKTFLRSHSNHTWATLEGFLAVQRKVYQVTTRALRDYLGWNGRLCPVGYGWNPYDRKCYRHARVIMKYLPELLLQSEDVLLSFSIAPKLVLS